MTDYLHEHRGPTVITKNIIIVVEQRISRLIPVELKQTCIGFYLCQRISRERSADFICHEPVALPYALLATIFDHELADPVINAPGMEP